MESIQVDLDVLREFERGLDPQHPEQSQVPARVLGYGEISTVFAIEVEGLRDLAFKRLPIFRTQQEMEDYRITYEEYNRLLLEEVDLHLPAYGHASFSTDTGRPVFYIIQKQLGFVQVPFGDLAALEAAIDDSTAAVLFETIPATMGIVVPPEGFFAGVRRLCDQHEAVMIIDEVQTGLGRCGAIWGIDTYGVIPDILVTAKGLSGGIYPITATIYREHLDPFLRANPFIHVSTFGGAEVGCYAAIEVLNILQEPEFLEHVRKLASLFQQGFVWLKERHPAVLVEVRQRGLMMGIKTASAQFGPLLTLAGFQHGLLTIYANHDQSVNQLLPSLTIREEEAQQVIEILDRMLAWLEGFVEGRG